MHINWLIVLGLFIASIALDAVYAAYTVAIIKSQPGRAATFSLLTYILSAVGVVSYVDNKIYLIPLAAGAFVGTYIVIEFEARRQAAAQKPELAIQPGERAGE